MSGSAAEIVISAALPDITPEDQIDLLIDEDEDVPVGSGFEYDEDTTEDRFGQKRMETELQKLELLGTSVNVSGQVWTVCRDITPDTELCEEFLELGIRSTNIDLDGLPKRCRSRSEMDLGTRSPPRFKPTKG